MEILNICDKNFFDKSIWKKLKKLYIGAFPANERAPFYMLKKRAKQGRGENRKLADCTKRAEHFAAGYTKTGAKGKTVKCRLRKR